MNYYHYLKPFIFKLDPEIAHNLAIFAAKYHLLPNVNKINDDQAILANKIWQIDFAHPIGLAAGFDKNAEALNFLLKQDFAFVEMGTVTPKAQIGNPKPRLFRLEEDEAIINAMGFNNYGLEVFSSNIVKRSSLGIVGSNIGKNKDSLSATEDYLFGLEKLYNLSDYITINVSSPNTPGLRNLQHKEELANLLKELYQKKLELIGLSGKNKPILLKIAPDLNSKDLEDIIVNVIDYKIDGIIISNTTIKRDGLISKYKDKPGGLSGSPLFEQATKLLKDFYRLSEGKIPIIASGGIFSGEDAYLKIINGASLLQLYTVLIYQGFEAVQKIKQELITKLKSEGLTLQKAIGINVN